MPDDLSPVVARVPGDFAGGVDFDGHDLADAATLDEDNGCANAPVATAALFPALNIGSNEGVSACDVCTCYQMCTRYCESREDMSME